MMDTILPTLGLLFVVFGFVSTEIGDEVVKCGMENEHTVGTKYNIPNLHGAAHTEIEDHMKASRRSYHGTSRDESAATPRDRERRVINGTIAKTLKDFPWIADLSLLVSLYENDSHPFNIHLCGGAIISEYHILTAAHCLEKTAEIVNHRDWSISLRVSVGEFDQSEEDSLEEHFEVESAILHENYNVTDMAVNDIALIKVKAKDGHGILFNEHIKPVCLPSPHTPYTKGNLLVVGGWGLTYAEHDILKNYSRYIHTAEVPIMSISSCEVYCNLFSGLDEIDPQCATAGHLCLGYEEGGISTCNGDSGGPVVQNINGRFILMGLTSFGYPVCATKGYPGGYTKVQHFLPWIRTAMGILNDE